MQITEDMLRVGVISSTHGIKGEVKVFPTTEDVKRFGQLKKVYLKLVPKGMLTHRKNADNEEEAVELTVAGVKYFKQFVILRFREINDINEVEKYKGMELYVAREDAIPLEEGEYFVADLIGLKVMTQPAGQAGEDYVLLGTLKDVMKTGANDVYVVDGTDSFAGKEIMIPAIRECIQSVDLKEKIMKVHLLEGLLEL